MGLNIIILAAGRGERMVSNLPKVLHTLGGLSLLEHVVKTARKLEPNSIHIVYGNGGSIVPKTLQNLSVNWIEQKELLGTGHAVMQALPYCDDEDQVLILYGDVPLISTKTLLRLLEDMPHHGLGLVVAEFEDPRGFGRIIRNEMSNIIAIVEDKDATIEQRKIKEINTGIMAASAKHLKMVIPKLTQNNKQHEYYLTDIVALAVDAGIPVGGVLAHCTEEVKGVNDRWQLSKMERYYQEILAQKLAYSGVMIIDPERLNIRGEVNIAADTVLDVNIVMEGQVFIGKNCRIGPNVYLKNARIGDFVEIKANCVVEDAIIENSCSIGPFARIRPQTVIEDGVKIGNFVEIKKSRVGKYSQVNHLTYIGDADVGEKVNIGAGTITCNYDGANKWSTKIGDQAFIGSNTLLVAPVNVGAKATIASGSIIRKDAPPDQLTLTARLEQRIVQGWQRPIKEGDNS